MVTARSPVAWLVAVLVVLVVGVSVSVAAVSSARQAADQRLSAGTSMAALESMLVSRMALATHGDAPFTPSDGAEEERQLHEHQAALVESAPHAEAAISTFVGATLGIEDPGDAAREYELARLIIDTRAAVLDPLDERVERSAWLAGWAPVVTGLLGVGATGGALWSLVRAPDRPRGTAVEAR